MGDEFAAEIEKLQERETLRAVILTGQGRAFSAGGDLDWLMERHTTPFQENVEIMMAFYKRFLSIRMLRVPVIAAINGPAIGAGACLARACDVRIASKKSEDWVHICEFRSPSR